MTNTKDIIMKLKDVRDEKGYSYADIVKMVEEKGDFVSKTTVSRVFSENSEEMSFNYENTIRPIANALLDIETIEDDDNMDVRAMKTLLKYKIQRIEELETQNKELKTSLDKEKLKYHDKLEKEREQFRRSTEFLKDQISLKDRRYDTLLATVSKKDELYNELLNQYLTCPYRKKYEENK